MKKHNFLTYSLLFITTFLSSCDFGPGSKTLGSWDVEMFGPVSQIKLNINDLVGDTTQKLTDRILLSEDFDLTALGLPGGAYPFIPPISGLDSDPVSYEYENVYETATFKSGKVSMIIYNHMPFNIKKNSELVMENESLTEVISSHKIVANIEPLYKYVMNADSIYLLSPTGEIELLETNPADGTLSGVTITSKVNLSMKNLGTDGKSTPGVITDDDYLEMTIEITEPQVTSVRVDNDFSYQGEKAQSFHMDGDQISIEDIEGKFNVHINNGYPMVVDFQIYFLEEDGETVIDSLFDDFYGVEPAPINTATGEIIGITEDIAVINLTKERALNIKKAKFVKGELNLTDITDSDVGTVLVTENDYAEIKMIGDLKVTVNKGEE